MRLVALLHRHRPKVLTKDIELEYLGGGRETVPIEKVESSLLHLRSRDRVLSLTRQNLCYALYGEAITRLRQARADQMKRFLRSHGLRFHPNDWTASARIQIWPDDSHVKTGPSIADRALGALLRKWLKHHRLPAGSRDPLGFQNHAERLANEPFPFLPPASPITASSLGQYRS
jgi:hypothetical protein